MASCRSSVTPEHLRPPSHTLLTFLIASLVFNVIKGFFLKAHMV